MHAYANIETQTTRRVRKGKESQSVRLYSTQKPSQLEPQKFYLEEKCNEKQNEI